MRAKLLQSLKEKTKKVIIYYVEDTCVVAASHDILLILIQDICSGQTNNKTTWRRRPGVCGVRSVAAVLPYVGLREASLAAGVALGVISLVQGTGEAGAGGVCALAWGRWSRYAHQARKQTGLLLWCRRVLFWGWRWDGVRGQDTHSGNESCAKSLEKWRVTKPLCCFLEISGHFFVSHLLLEEPDF